MKATNLDDEEKKCYLREHFYYEVKMLVFSVPKIIEFQRAKNQGSTNMALEDCLLHARNLMEFFYYKPHKLYLRAYDFVENKTKWDRDKPEKTHWIKEVERRANKELAHLAHGRIYGTPPEKGWECGAIVRDFLKVVKVFLDHLPGEYMGENLREIKQICLDVDRSIRWQGGLSTPVGTTTTVSTVTRLESNSDYSRYPDGEDPERVSKKISEGGRGWS